jgi:hypothetical protein
MSPKAKRIPRRARWGAKFNKWAKSIWRDVRGKAKSNTKTGKNDPWPICPLCDRQKPPWIFDQCEEHPGTCGCCLYGLHGTPPQGGTRQRKKARPDQFKPGDPASAETQHANRQAQYQAEIVEQARQETQAQEAESAGVGAQDRGGEE